MSLAAGCLYAGPFLAHAPSTWMTGKQMNAEYDKEKLINGAEGKGDGTNKNNSPAYQSLDGPTAYF